ncbi:unnamed protein product [marine sediment metagenome]|uniref:Uncharacterized protein n=1 Tax=marine sediment metagenome TaxID=412755 RepID=X1CQA5_9ZZZZ
MVEAVGWDMYDPRLTLKANVKQYFDDGTTVYAIAIGDCCYIDGNGLIQLSDADKSTVHGCALMAAVGGDELTLVTHGRLRMVTAQTPGDDIKSDNTEADGGGEPPSTTNATGSVCGYAISAYLVWVHVTYTSTVHVAA